MPKPRVVIDHLEKLKGRPNEYLASEAELIKTSVSQSLSHFPGLCRRISGGHVLIKPNFVRPNPQAIPHMTTDLRVLNALVSVCRDLGATRVSIGEKPGFAFPARRAFSLLGLDSEAMGGADLIAFDESPWTRVAVPNADVFRSPLIPTPALECDVLINVPKMKTHMHTLVSLGMKNFQGLVADDERMLFHRNDISHKIVDTVLARTPDFTLIDGLWPMEGQAPFFGQAVERFNVLIAGDSVMGTDVLACTIMGFSPQEVTHLRLAKQKGLGSLNPSDYFCQGTPWKGLVRPFKRPVISSAGLYPHLRVIEGGVCRGCLSAIRHSIDKLEFEGKIATLPSLTLFSGRPMLNYTYLPDWTGELWLFGNCALDLIFPSREQRQQARILRGCPPHVLDLHQAWCAAYDL